MHCQQSGPRQAPTMSGAVGKAAAKSSSSASAATAAAALSLTNEQRAVVEQRVARGETLVVDAFAGSGKTATIVRRIEQTAYPRDRPPLYIAFNRTTQAEMVRRVAKGVAVDVRTYHSLAHAYVRAALQRRALPIDAFKAGGVYARSPEGAILARYWKDASADGWAREPQPSHKRRRDDDDERDLEKARAAWHRMQSDASVPWSQDAVLKYFCAGGAKSEQWLAAHYSEVIVDEAQDLQAVLVHWLLSLSAVPLVLVGDSHQSIYSFAGARNAIETAKMRAARATTLRISHSFRFGATIAACASHLLHVTTLLARNLTLTGVAGRRDRVVANKDVDPVALRGPITCIARANATIWALALKALAAGRQVQFVGRSREVVASIGLLLDRHPTLVAVRQRIGALASREHCVTDPSMAPEQSGEEDEDTKGDTGAAAAASAKAPPQVVDCAPRGTGGNDARKPLSEAERDELEKLRMIVECGVNTLRSALAALKQQARKRKRDRTLEFTLCTVHGAKGLEWDNVYMCDDFPCLGRLAWGLAQASLPPSERSVYKTRFPLPGSCDCLGHKCNMPPAWRILFEAGLAFDADNAAEAGDGLADDASDDVSCTRVDTVRLKEEVHVYYVAMTRARRLLYANASLTPFLQSCIDY